MMKIIKNIFLIFLSFYLSSCNESKKNKLSPKETPDNQLTENSKVATSDRALPKETPGNQLTENSKVATSDRALPKETPDNQLTENSKVATSDRALSKETPGNQLTENSINQKIEISPEKSGAQELANNEEHMNLSEIKTTLSKLTQIENSSFFEKAKKKMTFLNNNDDEKKIVKNSLTPETTLEQKVFIMDGAVMQGNVIEDNLPHQLVFTEISNSGELTGKDLTKESSDKNDLTGKDLTEESSDKNDLTEKDLTKENSAKNDLTGKDLTKENSAKNDLTGKDLTKENSAKNDLTGKDLTKESSDKNDLTGKDLTKENSAKNDLTGKDLTKESSDKNDLTEKDPIKENLIKASTQTKNELPPDPISSQADAQLREFAMDMVSKDMVSNTHHTILNHLQNFNQNKPYQPFYSSLSYSFKDFFNNISYPLGRHHKFYSIEFKGYISRVNTFDTFKTTSSIPSQTIYDDDIIWAKNLFGKTFDGIDFIQEYHHKNESNNLQVKIKNTNIQIEYPHMMVCQDKENGQNLFSRIQNMQSKLEEQLIIIDEADRNLKSLLIQEITQSDRFFGWSLSYSIINFLIDSQNFNNLLSAESPLEDSQKELLSPLKQDLQDLFLARQFTMGYLECIPLIFQERLTISKIIPTTEDVENNSNINLDPYYNSHFNTRYELLIYYSTYYLAPVLKIIHAPSLLYHFDSNIDISSNDIQTYDVTSTRIADVLKSIFEKIK